MKRKTQRIITGIALAVCVLASLTATAFAKDIRLYDSHEVTEELLSSRGPDTLIVEKIVGIVMNEDGDGRALNALDPEYNYISYSGLGYEPLDIVMTLVTYNPDTQYIDDIIVRQDVRIGTLNEFRIGNFTYKV